MVKVKATVEFQDLHSVEDAAKLLGFGEATAWRWIRAGKIITVALEGRTLVPQSEINRIKNAETGADATPVSKEVSGGEG